MKAKPETKKKSTGKVIADKLVAHAKPQCTLDHSAEGGVPKALCRICTPPSLDPAAKAKVEEKIAAARMTQDERRDPRIPKGMSTQEGNAMLARRHAEKADKRKAALALLEEKQTAEFARINGLREKSGMEKLPDQYRRSMKVDPARNDKMFLRADANPEKMESDKSAKAKTAKAAKTNGKAKANGTGRKGAFTPEITSAVLAMLKKGTTAKAIIDAAKWGSCPNPVKRVNRFVTDVAEKIHKLKIVIDGRGEDAAYKTE